MPGLLRMAPPRLRRAIVVASSLLLAVALLTCTVLVVLTSLLRQQTNSLGEADARMRASLRTKVALLWFARESDEAVSSGSRAARHEQTAAEADLRSALADTRRLATPERVEQLDSLSQKGEGYIALRHRLDAQGLPVHVVLERSTPSLDAVFADLQQLIAADEAWAQSVETAARRWHSLADGLGGAGAALLVFGFVATILGMHRLVERPVLAMTGALARFAAGEERSRSEPRGAREVRQMASTFNDMADRLVRQKYDRFAFLAGVAHDLRNPLAALQLALRTTRRAGVRIPPEKATHTLEIVGRQVDRLDRMVGDLVDATRVEAGQLELRPENTDLRKVAERVIELLAPTTTHPIVLRGGDEALLAKCDPTRIEQVITNLVSNAIKYSPGGGAIQIALLTEGSEAVIEVSDQGMGIDSQEQERIFEPFRRSPRSQALVPGIGIGLSVARKIVEAHGGRIQVQSQLGRGSTFGVHLPRASAPR